MKSEKKKKKAEMKQLREKEKRVIIFFIKRKSLNINAIRLTKTHGIFLQIIIFDMLVQCFRNSYKQTPENFRKEK